MPSHFSSIGFRVETREEFGALARQAADKGQEISTGQGFYICWSPGAEVQLWLQTSLSHAPAGCNPHFAGSSRVEVAVTAALPNDKRPLDGSFHCWAEPRDGMESGAYPFLFDCPDFAIAAQSREYPFHAEAQVTAFAEDLTCYTSESAYTEAQRESGKGPGLAAEAFIPSGLFTENSARPRATAVFTGRILEAERRANPVTSAEFYWLSVQSYGGIYDVVADPTFFQEPPVVGGIVKGSFWLSGRLLMDEHV